MGARNKIHKLMKITFAQIVRLHSQLHRTSSSATNKMIKKILTSLLGGGKVEDGILQSVIECNLVNAIL